MTEDDWLDVIARIGADPAVIDLTDAPAAATPPLLTLRADKAAVAASRKLWPRGEEIEAAAIGILILSPVADVPVLALRLASVAVERGLMPVILTTLDRTGLERYGFRVQRISDTGAGPDATEVAEIVAYWDMALVIDAADIAQLG